MTPKRHRRWRDVRRSASYRRKVRREKAAWLRGHTVAAPAPEPDVSLESLQRTVDMLATMFDMGSFDPEIRGVVVSPQIYSRLKEKLRAADPEHNPPPQDPRVSPPFPYANGLEVRVNQLFPQTTWFWTDRHGKPMARWFPVAV